MRLLKRLFGTWSSLSAFNRLPAGDRSIVFYSEGKQDWPHLGPIVEELASMGRKLCYVTSEETDPVFALGNPKVLAFHIGTDSVRTVFFKGVDAKVVVMTMPDLETFHLKRSVNPAHYVYVFHSIVSSHMIYRKSAFDAYDTVLCVGPHHVAEIRKTEEIYRSKPKQLLEHGYARLDKIQAHAAERPAFVPSREASKKILLAPSWGECSFVEPSAGAFPNKLIEILLGAGHTVTLRLHPMTVRRMPKLAPDFAGRYPKLGVETDMNAQESLQTSDLMVSDWSGAAFDYAFGLERPVLFVDTPKKVNNPEWEKLGIVSLEERVREEIGAVLDPSAPENVIGLIEKLCADPGAFRTRLKQARDAHVYNVGRSAAVGASHIARIADQAPSALAEAK